MSGECDAMTMAPTMASANAAGVRFKVDRNNCPPGFSRLAQAAMMADGSGTCSSISMQVMASKLPGCSVANASTDCRR